MLFPNPHWKLCSLILVASSLVFHQTSYAIPSGTLTVREITKREAPEMVLNISAISPRVIATERKQRFCLNRLRDALISVCGGNGRMPQFFDPNQHQSPVINRSIGTVVEGAVKNFKNDIPAMAQQQPRRVLRRRSRRNIVRECCDKPCSYSHLLKYCSPSARLNSYQNPVLENQQGYNVPPQQQCVSVADLQHFYLKFMRKQWKKSDQQAHIEEHESEIPGNWNDAYSDSDTISKNMRILWKEPLPVPTDPTSEQEGRDVNEINENSEIESTSSRVDQSGNLYTLPPVTRVMNIPFGLNDYLY